MKSAEIVHIERDEHRIAFTLSVPQGLCYFPDHFAVFPLLPGVVQIDWAVAYAKTYFTLATATKRLEQVKFQAPIRPGDTVQLVLQFEAQKNRVSFYYDSARGRHSSGRIVFD